MDEQRQDDHVEPIYNWSMRIKDVGLKTYWERWTIGTGGDENVRKIRADSVKWRWWWWGWWNLSICLAVRVFAHDAADQDSIPGLIILKTQKMVLDSSLLNTQRHKLWIKNKVDQSRERNLDLPYTSVLWLLTREPLGYLWLWSTTLFLLD